MAYESDPHERQIMVFIETCLENYKKLIDIRSLLGKVVGEKEAQPCAENSNYNQQQEDEQEDSGNTNMMSVDEPGKRSVGDDNNNNNNIGGLVNKKIKTAFIKNSRATFKKIKETCEHLQMAALYCSKLKNENDIWRKSIVIDCSKYLNQNDKIYYLKHPTHGIKLDSVKWPFESSTGAAVNKSTDD
jgi:hypothetical protein